MGVYGSKRARWFVVVVGLVILGVAGMVYVSRLNHYNSHPRDLIAASSLASAVEDYWFEYGRLPEIPVSWMETSDEHGVQLLQLLTASEQWRGELENPRGLMFFDDRYGLFSHDDEGVINGMYDQWGRPFRVALNLTNADELSFQYGGHQVRLRGKVAAVWSLGKDGVEGTKDDGKSW